MGALYGTSIDTTSPTFATLTDDGAILRQWVQLTLQTALGTYWSDPDLGGDLCQYVLRGLTPTQLAAIPGQVEASLADDQRIASVSVTTTTTYTAVGEAALKFAISVTPKDASVAPFSLAAVASAAVIQSVIRGT